MDVASHPPLIRLRPCGISHPSSQQRGRVRGSERALAFELLESKLLPPHRAAGTVLREGLISAVERRARLRSCSCRPVPAGGRQRCWPSGPPGRDGVSPGYRLMNRTTIRSFSSPISRSRSIGSRSSTRECSTRWRQPELRSRKGRPPPRCVPREIAEPFVLVLDDLHLLHNPVCLDAITALAKHVPDGSQLALSTRGGPALSLAALRANGLALEVGPEELRMDGAEARQLLSGAGVEVSDDQLAELVDHTEGWSAGLYLAALADRARGPKPRVHQRSWEATASCPTT